MNDTRKKHLSKLSDSYAEGSNLITNLCNEASRNLNGVLMTASLAYIGVITATFSNTPQTLSCIAKVFIILGILCFVASTISGIIEAFCAIKLFEKTAPKYMDISNLYEEAACSNDEGKINDADKLVQKLQEKENRESGKYLLLSQISTFIAGTFLTFLYILVSIA